MLDILVQSRRNCRAAVRFFRKLLKRQGCVPRRLITDKLRSYAAACRTVMPSVVHSTDQYANNRAEVSHQPTRQRERQMRRFKSAVHLQRFTSVHGVVQNLFRVGRDLLRAADHRLLQTRAFVEWDAVTCASAERTCSPLRRGEKTRWAGQVDRALVALVCAVPVLSLVFAAENLAWVFFAVFAAVFVYFLAYFFSLVPLVAVWVIGESLVGWVRKPFDSRLRAYVRYKEAYGRYAEALEESARRELRTHLDFWRGPSGRAFEVELGMLFRSHG